MARPYVSGVLLFESFDLPSQDVPATIQHPQYGLVEFAFKLEEAAQKADAYQSNRNLLLSSEARVDSIPQLEIAANEVRCTHGSTTAPVDEMQLFYLMSRGVPKHVAQQVLVKAHLYDVLTRIPLLPLREHIERIIEEKVRL